MKPPSIEFIILAARGIGLILAFVTLAWVIVRWRRDTTRDAQRMFEQLDLVRAELLQMQGHMGSAPVPSALHHYQAPPVPVPSAPSRPAARQPTYSDFDTTPQRVAQPHRATSETVKTKSMTNAAPRGYEVAARLARNGASAEELTNTCALSRNEAELLVRLHSGMKSMQPPAAASSKNDKPGSGVNSTSRTNSNLNQLKNIGDRNQVASKPATSLTNRPATSLRPATQRVSLVG